VVVVKRGHLMSAKEWEILAGLLKSPPASATVAIAFAGTKRDLPKGLPKKSDDAALVLFGALKKGSAKSWLKERAREKGKSLESEAAELIVLLVGEDPALLAEELEKCLVFAGEKKSVTAKDVDAVVGDVRLSHVFELTDLVASRDGAAALKILGKLMLAGEDPGRLLGLLNWQLKNIWFARERLEERITAKELGSLIRPSWKVKAYLKLAEGFTLDGLAEGFETLLWADMALKSTTVPPRQVLEAALLKLCRTGP
jgi:DNA polymerase-3 subunit delta